MAISVYIPTNSARTFPFLHTFSSIIVCRFFDDEHLGCFHVLAIVNSAAMNNGIYALLSILVSSGYMPRSGIAGSYGGFILSF